MPRGRPRLTKPCLRCGYKHDTKYLETADVWLCKECLGEVYQIFKVGHPRPKEM